MGCLNGKLILSIQWLLLGVWYVFGASDGTYIGLGPPERYVTHFPQNCTLASCNLCCLPWQVTDLFSPSPVPSPLRPLDPGFAHRRPQTPPLQAPLTSPKSLPTSLSFPPGAPPGPLITQDPVVPQTPPNPVALPLGSSLGAPSPADHPVLLDPKTPPSQLIFP